VLLRQFLVFVGAGNAVFGVVRLLRRQLLHRAALLEWGALVAINGAALGVLKAVARPTFDPRTSELVDGGGDITAGALEYVGDLLYVTSIAQCFIAFSSWFWMLMLVVRSQSPLPSYGTELHGGTSNFERRFQYFWATWESRPSWPGVAQRRMMAPGSWT